MSLLSAVGECVEALRSAIPRLPRVTSSRARGVVSPHVPEILPTCWEPRLMTAAIVCSDLSFSWPDGAPVLSGLTASFGLGRTGLIGVNGSGKSTLLKLIAGELRPGDGIVRARGEVGYLPQAITLGTRRTVSDLLGITGARAALHAIEAGETGGEAFAALGDDGDVEERARAWLGRGAILVASHDVPFLRSAGIT